MIHRSRCDQGAAASGPRARSAEAAGAAGGTYTKKRVLRELSFSYVDLSGLVDYRTNYAAEGLVHRRDTGITKCTAR